MKKIIFLLLLLFSSFLGIAQKMKINSFIYEQEGIYIFILCKPQLDYEVVGTVKDTDISINKSHYEMVNILLRCCKKEYSDAEAIIISDIKMEQADCIRLTD